LTRSSKTVLHRSGDSGHPGLIPDFRGNGFSFSPLSMMLAVGLPYTAFIMLRHYKGIIYIMYYKGIIHSFYS
jgi:hypothetical protein